ncbi:DASH complex, subunit Spc34 [Polychaeton citri CBS 116435]|uniref:DASH complex subunit SPC34 n=1 Tax=Polychaeton citri CBS 116435 TaxID=1314669 RepID=A0A9P4QDL7_9PEZI|nr:DASH complex, subunit Spc34 [Polychaeton citri CBS 116435]
MATLLASHLEQISLCSNSISSLEFQGPRIFASALLSTSHDITSLIRDTEQHERALFHLAPPASLAPGRPSIASTNLDANALDSNILPTQTPGGQRRRATVYGGAAAYRQPRNKAVAAVLGGEMYARTRQQTDRLRVKGELDVELLLQGAEKLAAVYPIAGASDRISQLRQRHQQLTANIAHYEAKVQEQARELSMYGRPNNFEDEEDEDLEVEGGLDEDGQAMEEVMTREGLEEAEEEIRQLERRKRGLEERVTGMEKDLGGLMR